MTKQTQDALLMLIQVINDGSIHSNSEEYYEYIRNIVTTD
jgi:hypothetical protein